MPSAEPVAASAPQGLRYDELHRRGPAGGWRALAGLVLVALLFVVGQFLLSAGFVVVHLLTSRDTYDLAEQLDGDPVTPSFLAFVNLTWALAIPIVVAVALVLHRQRPGWIASVTGRLRWGWLAACLGLSVVALLATLLVGALVPEQGSGTVDLAGPVNDWSRTTRDFLLVILLLTPLQTAGEEYAFRGYLTQACGGLAGRLGRRAGGAVAVVVPAVLFAVAHGSQDLPIFVDRLAFGLVAGVLVLLTGGLEAAIAMHVLNNFLAFGLALAFDDMTTALQPSDGTWWSLPVTLTQSLSYLVVVAWTARRTGVAARTDGPILEGRRARV